MSLSTTVGSFVWAKSGFLSRNSADVIKWCRSSAVVREPASFGPITSSLSGSRSSSSRYAQMTCSRVNPPGWAIARIVSSASCCAACRQCHVASARCATSPSFSEAVSDYNPQLMHNIRVMHFGLGPIGAAIVKQIAARPGFKIVGAIDIDPAKSGRDLADVVGLSKRLGVKVVDGLAKLPRSAKPDIAVLCTSSSIKTVMPQIKAILESKMAIVSTTEELSYPGYTHIGQARQIHAWAKKAKVAVLGTGVNPGFPMDALPIALSAVCERVDRVVVHRVQDARIRRLPFQQKIGAGLTTEQFQKKVDDGSVRHVGLTESIAMIADAMGWTLDRITDDIEPRLASVTISSEFLAVDAGYVCGIVQEGVGYKKGEPVIRLHMEAYLGAVETYDAVDIDGLPRLSVKIPGGIHGDLATASLVVNTIPKVLDSAPGLHTMRDLPLPSFFPGR